MMKINDFSDSYGIFSRYIFTFGVIGSKFKKKNAEDLNLNIFYYLHYLISLNLMFSWLVFLWEMNLSCPL